MEFGELADSTELLQLNKSHLIVICMTKIGGLEKSQLEKKRKDDLVNHLVAWVRNTQLL